MDNRLFTLETSPIEIIAGDTATIPYQALKQNGDIVNLGLSGTEIEWKLSPYNELGVVVLTKKLSESQVVLSTDGVDCFNVTLYPADTQNLSGMFTYQIIITDPNGAVNRRVQGNIHIWQSN